MSTATTGVDTARAARITVVALAVVTPLTIWHFGFQPVVIPMLILSTSLTVLSVIDTFTYRLPREISYSAFVMSATAMVIIGIANHNYMPFVGGITTAIITTAIMAVAAATIGGIGQGDIHLTPLLGLHLGYISWTLAPVALLASFFSFALIGLARIALTKATRKTEAPFGPYLAACTLATIYLAT